MTVARGGKAGGFMDSSTHLMDWAIILACGIARKVFRFSLCRVFGKVVF